MSSDLWSMAAVAALFLAISMKSWKAILSWLWFVLMNVPASQALSLTPRPGQHVEAFIVLFVAIVIWQVALFVKDRMKSQRPPVLQS
ncbi:MAG: hypothetical protein KJ065_26835 [Anaerolineae bacterium]|nr:hypothetical protein [Anaerolineae bacterium]